MAFFEKRINLVSEENSIELVDMWLNFDVSVNTELSEFPIEPGRSVIDHIIPKPLQFSMTGYKADFDLSDETGSNVNDSYVFHDTITSAVWDDILEASIQGHIFTVITPTKEYPNIIIERVESGMNKETGYSLRFVLHMREVIYGSIDRPGFLRRLFSNIFGRDRNVFDRGDVDLQLVNNIEVTNRIMQSGQFRVTPSGTIVPL